MSEQSDRPAGSNSDAVNLDVDRDLGRNPAAMPPPGPGWTHLPESAGAQVRVGTLVRWGFFVALGALGAYGVVRVVLSARNLLVLVVVAMFLAVSLDPLVRWLVGRGLRRGVAVGLIWVAVVAVLTGFVVSLIPPLSTQAASLAHNLPDYLANLQIRFGWFRRLDARYHLATRLEGVIGQLPARLAGGVVGFTGRVLSTLAAVLTVLVFTVYFMLDLPRLRAGVVRLFPVDRRQRYRGMVEVVVDKVGTYMIARLAIGVVSGLVALVGLVVLHIPYPLPLAIIIGALDVIPLLGHPIGALIAVVVALFTVRLWPTTVVLVGFFVIYQQLENYVLGPRILRSSVDLSAAAVLFAALVGAAVLGVVGVLLAIPLAAAVKVLLVREIDQHEAHALSRRHPRTRRRREPDRTGTTPR